MKPTFEWDDGKDLENQKSMAFPLPRRSALFMMRIVLSGAISNIALPKSGIFVSAK